MGLQARKASESMPQQQRVAARSSSPQRAIGHNCTLRAVVSFTMTVYFGSFLLFLSFQQGRNLSNKYSYGIMDDAVLEKNSVLQVPASTNTNNNSNKNIIINNKRPTSGITCQNEKEGPCCASWEYNADDWWLDHPDWQVSHENDTTFCFSKILQDERKAALFRKIHNVQWTKAKKNCTGVLQRTQINSGWAASFGRVADAVWAAVHHDQPVQITKHWEGMLWLYATNDTNSWAYCEAQDMSCYLLPQSPCPQVIGQDDDIRRTGGKINNVEWLWLKEYVGRMRQPVRRKIYEMLQKEFPPVKLPCTAMHVRRGDSGIPRRPFRRYAAISEYLEIGEIQLGETIVLLTDDTSTIQEVERYHPNYNWVYMNRPRNSGPEGGFDGHVPSNDAAFDFVAIHAELQLASQCNKLVHGSSSFADTVHDAMTLAGNNTTRFALKTTVSKEEAQANYNGDIKARGHLMLNEIEGAYQNDTKAVNGTRAVDS